MIEISLSFSFRFLLLMSGLEWEEEAGRSTSIRWAYIKRKRGHFLIGFLFYFSVSSADDLKKTVDFSLGISSNLWSVSTNEEFGQ